VPVQPSWGVGVAVEMGDSYLGVEHALLAMIRNRETVAARALAGLADLDALEAAVVEAMNAPVESHEDAVFLPEGQQLDGPCGRNPAGIPARFAAPWNCCRTVSYKG